MRIALIINVVRPIGLGVKQMSSLSVALGQRCFENKQNFFIIEMIILKITYRGNVLTCTNQHSHV